MRDVILKRLDSIRKSERDFSENNQRWKNFKFVDHNGHSIHVSKVKFEELTDDELVSAFETVIQRFYKSM